MKSVKDNSDQHQYTRVYKVIFSCDKCYIIKIGRSFQVRIKEHGPDIKNVHTFTFALAEHLNTTKHQVCLEDTKILAKEDHFYKRIIREAIEIIEHPNNLNMDGGLNITENELPLINNEINM